MPYKSLAQERYFHANKDKLEKQGVNVGEWDSASKGLSLPDTALQKEKVRGDNMSGKWMQKASEGIAESGHKGIFKAAAKRAGKSTREFAEEHKDSPGKLGKRARLAISFMSADHSK